MDECVPLEAGTDGTSPTLLILPTGDRTIATSPLKNFVACQNNNNQRYN